VQKRGENAVLRTLRRATPVALLLTLALSQGALAATQDVSIVSFAFQPTPLKAKLGDTVHWTNNASINHTTTSDSTNPDGTAGVAWWDSGALTPTTSFDWAFTAAGTFTYHCAIHPTLMKATVSVKPKAKPSTGTSGTKFKITVATITAPTGFVYDVQKENPGGSFQDWMIGVTSPSVTFNSSGQPTGAYRFRARLRRTSTAGASEYSPPVKITVS